jgi:hypothetical protein
MSHLLKVGVPDALGLIVCVADIISHGRCLPAKFANTAHDAFLSGKQMQAGSIARSKENI